MIKKFFTKKSLQATYSEIKTDLLRTLDWKQLVVIGIGAIIGAGIFVITGKAAAEYAGPAIVLSFVFAAIICAFAGLCYAELSALIPVSGGSYSYAYIALGELPAWLIGWSVTAQYLFSLSTVAAGCSSYLKSFLKDWGISLSDAWSSAPLHYSVENGWMLTGSYINLPAVLLMLMIGTLVAVGIRAAARFTSIMVAIKLATIAIFILIGLPHVQVENLTPFIPENTGVFGEFGWSGIFRAAGLVFFAYIGFDTVSTLAQDAKNPQRDLPKGILGSLTISALAYIAVCIVLTGAVSYRFLGVADPMAVALNAMGPQLFWLASLIKIAIISALASVILVQLLGQTRLFFAIGQDGLLPKQLASLHPKFNTPVIGTAVATVAIMLLSGFFPVDILGQLVSMVTLQVFGFVCVAVLILRKTHPEYERPFSVPFLPWIPLAGASFCALQMAMLPLVTWMQWLAWMILGLVIYLGYGIKNSKLHV